KTTTLRAVIRLFQGGERVVRLAAPTGRAARRLSETSKMQAETIHRLLGFNAHTGKFAHDEKQPIEADLVVIDETPMLDVLLARDLLRAIPPGTCVLLVGDEDQLPPVGPGSLLRDLMASGLVPVVRLHEIFRQAQSSLIVVNAHRVNDGKAPLFDPPRGVENPDFFFIERREPAEVMETIKTLVAERIPKRYKLDPIRDIQVLTPMRRGELGVVTINRELQKALNPLKREAKGITFDANEFPEEESAGQTLRAGDRVMQTANNYDKEVFNGDIGWVASIDAETGEIAVKFEGRTVSYLADEARQLALAYASTIHKSQGSEYRAVVIPMHTQHYIMLRRNLLYTALTRGKELVCVVGTKQALWRAVRDDTRGKRNSALQYFLAKR
ncbi:AAA family ATPase, partial [Candidatus Sumerlaeota bacterium]|nr:AAA family ATPase [Candidatus Sumerlaeota bacterium]